MKKESFVLYDEYAEQFSLLSLEQRGILITAIFAYRRNDEMPDMDGAVKMAFSFIKAQISCDSERYEDICGKRRAAGATGGAPKGNQNAKKQANVSVLPNNQNKQNKQKQAKQPNGCKNKQNNQMDTTVFERKENEDEKEKRIKEKVEDKEKENYIKEKSTSVLKKKDDENFEDFDGRTDGQTDKPFCVEDDRTAKQREFFQLYPNVVVDNYSSSDYAEIDFNILIGRFEESAYLRSRNSFAWICSNWRKIAVGEYRDFDRRFERQERHSQSKSKLGSEWDDLD